MLINKAERLNFQRSMNNVILIGMPGSGKSTIGVVLAKVLGYEFLDTDILIQKLEGKKLSKIIEKQGINGFVLLENRIISEIKVKRHVIATGGSAVYGKEAMEHLKSIGKIIYLKIGYRELCNRLGDLKARGVVLKEGQSFFELYKERIPLYEKYADIIIDEKNKYIREIVNEISRMDLEK